MVKQWLENFECCLEFEGVIVDLQAQNPKKHVVLLVTKCWQLSEHFMSKRNLTVERCKFFNTKSLALDESHDRWITRLCIVVKDCGFDKIDNDETTKLVVTLHTTSEKLQTTIFKRTWIPTKSLQ